MVSPNPGTNKIPLTDRRVVSAAGEPIHCHIDCTATDIRIILEISRSTARSGGAIASRMSFGTDPSVRLTRPKASSKLAQALPGFSCGRTLSKGFVG